MARFWTKFPQVPGDSGRFLEEDLWAMYLDSAYIAKFYVNEPDSAAVRAAIRRAGSLVSSAWSIGEVTCVFHRHAREGALSQAQCRELSRAFLEHGDAGVLSLAPVSESLLRRMSLLVSAAPRSV